MTAVMTKKRTTKPAETPQPEPEEAACLCCDSEAACRGLCHTCLAAAKKAISAGEASDEELVELGLMAPRKQRKGNSGFRRRFLEIRQQQAERS